MNKEIKRKLRNIIYMYLFFIVIGISILGVQRIKLYIEHVRYERKQEAYRFGNEGFLRYRLSKLVGAKLEFANHKGNIYLIEDENDMKKIDTEKEEYITGKTEKFGSYRFVEGEYTQERIKNFNDNMKHIRLWDYSEKKYKTIAENEKMEEFTEVKNINELWEYMSNEVSKGASNIDKLDIVGNDGTEKPTKIIYDYGNGETKVLKEDNVIGLVELFNTDFSK